MDEKVKSEMRELHLSEPKRWTVGTLSARYKAPIENVRGVLRLARLRANLSEERVSKASELENAWNELDGRQFRKTTRVTVPDQVELEAEVEAGKKEGEDTSGVDVVGTTETAKWAREAIERGEYETTRKSTFAFIEVGKGLSDDDRAVWLRDGESGLLRTPADSAERSRILAQRRVVAE